jgi:glutamine cyclotransferase
VKVFLITNSDGVVVKVCSSLSLALLWAEKQHFHFDYRELSGITEFDVNGDTWGEQYSFDEFLDKSQFEWKRSQK